MKSRHLLATVFVATLLLMTTLVPSGVADGETPPPGAEIFDPPQEIPDSNNATAVALQNVTYANYSSERDRDVIDLETLPEAALDDLFNLTIPHGPAPLPVLETFRELTDIDPFVIPINITEDLPVDVAIPTVTEEDIVETIETVLEVLPVPFSGELVPGVPVANPLPGILPDLTYMICKRSSSSQQPECTQATAFGVPEPVNLNTDLVPDVLVTVTPCGLSCGQVNIDRTPTGSDIPAEIYVVYDTDGDASDSGAAIIRLGYDALSATGIPDTYHLQVTFTSSSTGWTIDGTLATTGVQLPLKFIGQLETRANNVQVEIQDVTATWPTIMPASIQLKVTMDNSNGKKTIYEYDTSPSATNAKTIITYYKYKPSDQKLDYTYLLADPLPATATFTSTWKTDGSESHILSGSTNINRVEYKRYTLSNLANPTFESIVEGTLTNVPTSLNFQKTTCTLSLVMSSSVGGWNGMTTLWNSGERGLLVPPSDPNYAIHVKTSTLNNVAVNIPLIKSFDAKYPCYNGQGYTTIAYELGGPLTSSVLIHYQVDSSITRLHITSYADRVMPSRANVESRPKRFRLYNTPDAFGSIDFCSTTTGHCGLQSSEDHIVIIESASIKTTVGRIRGLKTATVGFDGSSFEASATLGTAGQYFGYTYSSYSDFFVGHISNLPTSLTFTTDLQSTGRFVTNNAISELTGEGNIGGKGITVIARTIPANTDATFSYVFPNKVSFSSTTYIGYLQGCYTRIAQCGYLGENTAFVVQNKYSTGILRNVKSFNYDGTNSKVVGSLVSGGGYDFYAAHSTDGQTHDYWAYACAVPSSLSFSYDLASQTKVASYSGSTSTSCLYVGGPGFYAALNGIGSSFTARWNLDAATRSIVVDAGSRIAVAYVTANIGSGNWRSVTACMEGVRSFSTNWASDLSTVDASATDQNNPPERIRVRLTSYDQTACYAISPMDWIYYNQANPAELSLQVHDLKVANGKFTDAETKGSLTQNVPAGGRQFVAEWHRGTSYGFGVVSNNKGTFAFTTNNVDQGTWSSNAEVLEVVVLSVKPTGQFYLHMTGVPTSVSGVYDVANRQAKLTTNGKLTTATLKVVRPNQTPSIVEVFGAALVTTTVSWNTDGTAGSATTTSEDGYLSWRVLFSGNQYFTPYDTGVFRVNLPAYGLNFLTGSVKGLRSASWDFTGDQIKDATLNSSGGNGQTTFETLYYTSSKYIHGILQWVPSGTVTLKSDLKTNFNWKVTPTSGTGRVRNVFVYGLLSSTESYYVDALGVPSSVDFTYDANAKKLIGTLNGAMDSLYLEAKKTDGTGIAGSGYKYVIVDAISIPGSFSADWHGKEVYLDFGSGKYVGNLFIHASTNGRISRYYPDYLWMDLVGGEAYTAEFCGLSKALIRESNGKTLYGEEYTNCGRAFDFIVTRTNGQGQPVYTNVFVTNLPAWAKVELNVVNNPGGFKYTASHKVNGIVVFSNELGALSEYLYASIVPLPTSVYGAWTLGNPGNITLDVNERVDVNLCVNLSPHSICVGAFVDDKIDAKWSLAWSSGHVKLDTDWGSFGGYVQYVNGPIWDPTFFAQAYGTTIQSNDFSLSWWPPSVSGGIWKNNAQICGYVKSPRLYVCYPPF